MNLSIISALVFFVTFIPYKVELKIVPYINEDYEDCTTGERGKTFDLSGLKVVVNNGSLFIDGRKKFFQQFCFTSSTFPGEIKFKSDLKAPWTVWIVFERKKRGQWIVSIFNRYIPNFCNVMKLEHEPWYAITKHMKHDCPIPAGVSHSLVLNH